ncbi:MAG: hypothetical protein R3F37_04395 [Candidatus Competibacteraceae bacterium]
MSLTLTPVNLLTTVKPILLVIVIALLVWRIMALGLSEHYARKSDSIAIAKALSWHPDNPTALFEQGRLFAEQDPAAAETLLVESISADPTHAQTYLVLANLWEKRGLLQQATHLITVADDLAPERVPVQLAVAAFWLHQGQLEQALEHWNIVLGLRPAVRKSLYPFLLEVLTKSEAQVALTRVLSESPSWWESFFSYVANNAKDLNTVRILYRLMRAQNQALNAEQRQHYINRLQREQQWLEAYFVWLNHLDAKQRKVLGECV